MSKAILLLEEIPGVCVVCPYCDKDRRCWATDGKPTETQLRGTSQWDKPYWCPLRPVPEKKWGPDETNSYEGGYADGWNDCLDAIGGSDGGC